LFPRWLLWPLFAAAMGFALGGSFVSAFDQPNQSPHVTATDPTTNPSGNQHEPSKTFRERLSVIWDRTWEDPVAFYTFVLGIFTFLLFTVSAGQGWFLFRADQTARLTAEAMARQANAAESALLNVETPYLFPFVRRHGIRRGDRPKDGRPQVIGFNFGNNFLTYYFVNYGRTPAEIIEIFSVLQFSMGIPPPIVPPERPYNPLPGLVVTKDMPSEDFLCDLTENIFTIYMGGRKFNPDIHMVWFMGYVRFNDVFGNEYVRGFCLAYAPTEDKFYAVGRDGYNYRKKTKSAGEVAPDSGQKPAV
jgi:hypothetical protein